MSAVRVVHAVEPTHGDPRAPLARPKQLAPRTRSGEWIVASPRAFALDAAMVACGVTSEQLARWCGVTRQLVTRWRNGDRDFGDEHVANMRSVAAEFERRMRGAA